MSNSNYCFLTFDEQVDRLEKERGLMITNKPKLLSYLEKYNYENFVNNYCKYLTVGGWAFINGVTSDALIDLFEMDRAISNYLFPIISDIERNITTKIVYYIPKIMGKDHPELLKGNIINISDEEFRQIFPKVIGKDKDNEKSILLQKDDLTQYVPERIKEENPSLWKISIYWTTGTVCRVFKALDQQVRQEIVNQILAPHITDENHLEILLDLLNRLRNRICHNNMVYDYEYRPTRLKAKSFFQWVKRFSNRASRIKLYEVVKIIETFGYQNVWIDIRNIVDELKVKLTKSIKDTELVNNIYQKILLSMHII